MSAEPDLGDSCIHVEKGDDPRTLIIAFTGGLRPRDKRKYAFRDLCSRLGCNRILLRDPHRLCYMRGVDRTPGDFQSIVDRLSREIDRLSPGRTVVLGESIGGYAAILSGYLLRVDAVHTFSPFTYLNLVNIIKSRDWSTLRRRWKVIASCYVHTWQNANVFDLRRPLSRPNNKTRYYLHVGRGRQREYDRAVHLAGVPDVCVIPHPTDMHLVANYMIHQRALLPWLRISNGELDLSSTRTDDADLESIKAASSLTSLNLRDTDVTGAGIASLAEALPSLTLVS